MEKEAIVNKRKYLISLEDEADLSVFDEVFRDLDYRSVSEEISGAKNLILDLGAHKGFFSVYAHSLNDKVKIIALEPSERNYSFLKMNLKNNRIKNVICKKLAIDRENGEKELFLSEDSHNHSLINSTPNREKVTAVSLPDLLDRHGVGIVDLVKMDIEGAEFEVLPELDSSSPEIFSKIKCWFVEGHLYKPEYDFQKLRNIFAKYYRKIELRKSDYDDRMFLLKVY